MVSLTIRYCKHMLIHFSELCSLQWAIHVILYCMENMNPNYENPYSHTSGSVAENWFVESISPFSFLSVIYVFLILDPNKCNSIYSSLPPQKTKTHLNCKPERFLHLHICSRWYVTPFIQQTIWNISPLLTADVSVKQKQDRMCAFTLNRLIMLWLKHVFFLFLFLETDITSLAWGGGGGVYRLISHSTTLQSDSKSRYLQECIPHTTNQPMILGACFV